MISPLRVGLLFEYGTLNGGEFSMLGSLARLHLHQVDCVAVCPLDSPLRRELAGLGIPCLEPVSVMPAEALQAAALNRIACDHQLQLLHANSLAMGRRLGRLAPLLSCPTTSHLRDIVRLSRSAIADLNRHAGLVAVSHAVREYHLRQGLFPERTATIYNGVDLDRFRPRPKTGALVRELGLPEHCPLVANIGQICLRKGQIDLARAAVLLRDRFPELRFLFVGERHSTKSESLAFDREIDTIFQAANMSDRIMRLGFRTDIPRLLNEVTLLAHTALQEPLGRVLLEAAASGTPTVATNVGGTAEILEHQRSGLLIPPGDPQACATAITRLLTEPQVAAELGGNARRRMERDFSIETASETLFSWWRRIAASSG